MVNQNPTLVFSSIPENHISAIQRIECYSNPFPWKSDNLRSAYYLFSHLGGYIDNELVVFVLFRVIADEAEIIHLVCDKDYQDRGLSYQLMQKLLSQLSEIKVKSLFLEVRESNFLAQKLYDKLGFETVGLRKDYYGLGQNACIQRLSLKTQDG